VSALALQDAGLKGSFHSLVPDKQNKREGIRRTGLLRDVPLPEKRWAILCKSTHQFNLMRGIFIPLDVSGSASDNRAHGSNFRDEACSQKCNNCGHLRH
jgi:hypothetical protein